MPSKHLILCHPLLFLPLIFPSIRVFSNESVLCIRWPKYRSFSFSISPSNEYSGLISFRMDWLDLLAVQGTLKSLLIVLEFSRPEYWSGYPFPSPEELPNSGMEPKSPTLQADSLPAEPQRKPSVYHSYYNNWFFVCFYNIILFIYLDCAGSSSLPGLYSGCGEPGLLSSCSAQISHCSVFPCGARALGCVGSSSCGTWAQ